MKYLNLFGLGMCSLLLGCGSAPLAEVATAPPATEDPATASAVEGRELPSRFVGDRVFVTPMTEDGTELRFYTDSGGGFACLIESAAERFSLPIETAEWMGQPTPLTRFPAFRDGAWIPRPNIHGDMVVVHEDCEMADVDGFLGQPWFADRVWAFDYPDQRLVLHERAPAGLPPAHTIPLGFPEDDEGERVRSFASMVFEVEGESFPMLLDTGATLRLTPEALTELAESEGTIAASYIVASVFERWREAHPEWRVIENADANVNREPMIEVPEVDIAGHIVGPVWFTRRPDPNFHEWMSSMMDRRIDGALGGSAFRYFTMVIDYPAARATFLR